MAQDVVFKWSSEQHCDHQAIQQMYGKDLRAIAAWLQMHNSEMWMIADLA